MSTNLGPKMPDHVVQFLSGDRLSEKVGSAFLLTSVGEDGYPHPCIVTPGEVVASGPTRLRLALYASSSATRNLRARSAATLSLVADRAAYYIKGDVKETPAPAIFEGLATFEMTPVHVLEDKEPGAEMTSGLRFSDARGDAAVLEAWEKVVEPLRQLQ